MVACYTMINKSWLLSRTVLCASFLQIVLQVTWWLPHQWNRIDADRDVFVYYNAANDALHGNPLYNFAQIQDAFNRTPSYLYLPQFAAITSPLGYLRYIDFSRMFYIAELAAFWVFSYTLACLARDRPTFRDVATWGLILGITPKVYFVMGIANVDPMLWAFLGMALISTGRGAWLCVLAQIKVFYAVPLLLSILREGKQIAVPAAIAAIVGFSIGVSVCGVHSYVDWQYAAKSATQGRFLTANVSISFAVLRIARDLGWHRADGPLPMLAKIYLDLAGIVGTSATAYLARKLENRSYYVVCTLGALLFGPFCWDFYLVIAIILLALWVRGVAEA